MNPHLFQLMLQAGYAAPELAPRARKLCELLVRDCAKLADVAEPYRSQDLILDYYGVGHEPQSRN